MAGFDRKNIIKGNNSFYLQLGKGMRKKPKSPGVGAVFCMVSVRGREKKRVALPGTPWYNKTLLCNRVGKCIPREFGTVRAHIPGIV
jgi:hypothetical protein